MKLKYILLIILLLIPTITLADSPPPKILLVADAHYNPYNNSLLLPYYTNALESLGLRYDIYEVLTEDDNGPPYEKMKNYDIVIWFTGNDYGSGLYPTLTSADQGNLTKFLDNGGRLFLTGQDIGNDIGGTDFYKNYLHAYFCKDDIDDYDLSGTTGDPIGHYTSIDINGGAGNQEHPSLIFYRIGDNLYDTNIFAYKTQVSGIIKCADNKWYILWKNDLPGAIKADTGGPNGYKVVYFAFGFEGIKKQKTRKKVMNRTINYLAGPKTKNTKFWVRNLDNTGWEDFNITCDPTDSFCLRKENPIVNATCFNPQLFGKINDAEFFVNSTGEGNGTTMNAVDGSFDEETEIANGSVDVSSLSDGVYTINVHCKDSDNYWGKFDDVSFVVDVTPPIFSGNGLSIEKEYINEVTPKITISVLGGYEPDYMAFSCNNQSWTEWIPYQQTYSDFNITDPRYGCNSTEGNKTVYVKIRDKAGNLGTDSGYNVLYPSDWIIYDKTPPTINLISPEGWLNSGNVTFTFNFTDTLSPKANCSLYIDGTLNQINSSVSNNTYTSFTVTNLSEGIHTWNITCVDKAGNKNSSEESFSIDVTPPQITIQNPKERETYSGVVSLLTEISDSGIGVSEAWYRIVNSTNTSQEISNGTLNLTNGWDSTWNSTQVTNSTGNFTFIVYANDSLGNLNSKNASFKIDNQKPSATILFPREDFLNSNFNLSLKAERPGGNITNASYWIYNSSEDLVKSNESLITSPTTSFEKDIFINISSWEDGNYTIIFNVTDNLTNSANDKTWFYLDKTPPNLTNWTLDKEKDTSYGDIRIYKGEEVTFSVNVSEDVLKVDKVIVSVVYNNTANNYTLSPENGNYTKDKWSFSITPSQIGTYNITKIYANDSLGNLKEINITNLSFIVVKPSLELNFGQNNEIDAGQNASLNLTFYFNKTISNQNLTLYIPDYYTNLIPWNCTNCSVTAGKSKLNLTAQSNITSLKLKTILSAGTPPQDLNSTWNLEFREENYSATTKIKTPLLNITNISCEGCNYYNQTSCEVNQSQEFSLNFTIKNEQTTNHNGKAYNISFNLTSLLKNQTIYLGDLVSNSSNSTKINFNGSEIGTYNLQIVVTDSTGNYTTIETYLVEVKDILPPEFLGRSWNATSFNTNVSEPIHKLFNQNETIEYFVKAKDNVEISDAWLTYCNSTNCTTDNLSLENRYIEEYDIWKFSWKTDNLGSHNITNLCLNDTSGNLNCINLSDYFKIIKLNLSVAVENETILINKTQVFIANVSGNATPVSEVIANITLPNGETSSVTFSLQNSSYIGNYIPKESGNYSVNITVTLESGINKTNQLNFSVPYGNISISSEEEFYLINGSSYEIPLFIIPSNGDLINISANYTIENSTIINSSKQNPFISNKNISWKDFPRGEIFYLPVNSTNTGNTTVNITTYSEKNGKAVRSIKISVIQNDNQSPIIYNYTFYNITNLNEINKFLINTSDNKTSIKNVSVKITWPNNLTKTYEATLNPSNLYELDFEDTNITGIYNFTIISCDVAGNCENTTSKSFNVSKDYNVFATILASNKGDEVKFNVSVKNVRGEEINDFNLTLVVYNTRNNITVVNNTQTNYATYQIRYDDPPQAETYPTPLELDQYIKNYTAFISVERKGNFGHISKNFEVSSNLYPKIISPDSVYYPANTPINLSVELRDFDGNIVEYGTVTAYCPACSNKYVRLDYDPSTQEYVKQNAFVSPNEDFNIQIFASSYFGSNKALIYGIYSVNKPSTKGTAEAGGGAGGGGVGPTIPNCTCTEWKDEGCGAGGCALDEMYQTRVCNPAGCANESVCIYKPECVPKKDFRVSLSDQTLHIKQGETIKVLLNLENIGEEDLDLEISAEKQCCELNYTKSVKLKVGESTSFPIILHSSLSREAGEYLIDFSIKGGGLIKKVTLKVIVEENPLIKEMKKIKESLPEVEKKIKELKELGIDIKDLSEKVAEIKSTIKKANNAILSDNITALQEQVRRMKGDISYINFELLKLRIKEFLLKNKWNLLVAFIIALVLSYFLSQIIIPYIKLSREIKMLKKEGENLLETRKATERQYFTRKIDESTFRSIISKTQQQILKNRSELKNKKEEKEKIKEKIKPWAMIRWIFALPISIPKGIVSRIKNRRLKKKKEVKKKEERERLLKGRSIEEILREREMRKKKEEIRKKEIVEKKREIDKTEKKEEKEIEKKEKKRREEFLAKLKERLHIKREEEVDIRLLLAELKIEDLKKKGKETEELERELELIKEDRNMGLKLVAKYRLNKLEKKLEEL